MTSTTYQFDPSGTLTTNLIEGERQVLTPINTTNFYFLIPLAAPFFGESLELIHHPSGRVMIEGVDYFLSHRFHDASLAVAKPIYGSISFIDKSLTGVLELKYQTLGGEWTLDENKILNILAESLANPRITLWEQITDLPREFPPIDHEFNLVDLVGMAQVEAKLAAIEAAIIAGNAGASTEHTGDTNNPHQVTKLQIGLDQVQNLPLSGSQEAIDGNTVNSYMTPLRTKEAIQALVQNDFFDHKNNTNNPHGVNKLQLGLEQLANFPMADLTEAVQGISSQRYMSPLSTAAIIDDRVNTTIIPHVNNVNNPHQVTKSQVGLSNVENFGIATTQIAIIGVDNTFYMTPLRTRQAIDGLFGDTLINHVNQRSNPHDVTAAQIGLGLVANLGLASVEDAIAGNGDSGYMTPRLVAEAISNLAGGTQASSNLLVDLHIADRNNPHQVTATQLGVYTVNEVDAILTGKLGSNQTAFNSNLLNGLSLQDIERLVKSRFDYPPVDSTISVLPTWTVLGSYSPPEIPLTDFRPDDIVFYLTGGDRGRANEVPVYLVKLNIFDEVSLTIEQISGEYTNIQFGFVRDLTTQVITLYSKNIALRNAMSILVMSDPFDGMGITQPPVDIEPLGITYSNSFVYRGAAPIEAAEPGQVLFGFNPHLNETESYGNMFEMINVIDVADGDDPLAAQLTSGNLQDEINDFIPNSYFDRVTRIADKQDLLGWKWKESTQSISNVPSGLSLMTFNSPNAYRNYTFEVQMSSISQETMALGLCAAFIRKNGKDHGIYILKTTGGLAVASAAGNLPGGDIYKLDSVGYNLLQIDAIDLGSTNTNLTWGDGVADVDRAITGPFDPVLGGWNNNGSVAIKVIRLNNLIVIQTSQLGSTDVTTGSSFTIDLNSIPELAVFKEPTTFGLAKFKQGSAEFKIITRPDSFEPYVLLTKDLDGNDTSTINRFNGTVWESQSMDLTQSFIKPGRLYYSGLTRRSFASRRNGTLKPLNIDFFSDQTITLLTIN